jgi:hypothetical protein
MKIWKDYQKVLDVIDSCKTIGQLKVALKMLGFWYDKYLDYQIYQNTCRTHIEFKFYELGGVDTNDLY